MFWALEAGRVDARGTRVRAGRLRHPDAERVGDRGAARGDGDLGRGLSARRRPLRRCCRTARRWATATGRSSSRGSDVDLDAALEIVIPGAADDRLPRAAARARRDVRVRELPFDQILDEVRSGRADAGLLIHEGQLTYGDAGSRQGARPRRVVAAGDRPAAAARRQRGPTRPRDRLDDVSDVLGEAIRVGLENREEALAYAERFGRGIDRETADRFVGDVRQRADDATTATRGRQAIDELLRRERGQRS